MIFEYSVCSSGNLQPETPVNGQMLVTAKNGRGIIDFVRSNTGNPSDNGILLTTISEGSIGPSFLPVLSQLVTINGILTFGGRGSSNNPGGSHLEIIAKELHIPFCRALPPATFTESIQIVEGSNWYTVPTPEWTNNSPLYELNGTMGSMTLDQELCTVTVQNL